MTSSAQYGATKYESLITQMKKRTWTIYLMMKSMSVFSMVRSLKTILTTNPIPVA